MNKKFNLTVAQIALLMAILTLISKCFGFIREMVMANFFGTSYIVDAYVMATTILTVLFGGLLASISTAYIPMYSKIMENRGTSDGNLFTSQIIKILVTISIMISIIGIVFSDSFTVIFANGFHGETAQLTSFFIKILFSYIIFSSIAGILESYLQYKGVFLPQIVSGYVISICVIVAIIISAKTNFYYLAFGMLSGYFLRCVIMVAIAKKNGYKWTNSAYNVEDLKQTAKLVIPVFIGSYISYINVFIDKTIASYLSEGSIATLNYASLLNSLIIGITVTILSTIVYPKLTQANSLNQINRFNTIVNTGLNLVLIISLPCSLGAMLYSTQIVQIVYERGAFDIGATAMTGSAFFFYAMGIVFISVNELIIRLFYSMHDMKTPMISSGISVLINICLNLILVRYMMYNGLALATSIAAFCNSIILVYYLRRKHPKIKFKGFVYRLLKVLFASVISILLSYGAYCLIIIYFKEILFIRIVQLGIAVLVAGVVYLLLLKLLKIEEIKLVKGIFVNNSR